MSALTELIERVRANRATIILVLTIASWVLAATSVWLSFAVLSSRGWFS